jgi:hypothetical protein
MEVKLVFLRGTFVSFVVQAFKALTTKDTKVHEGKIIPRNLQETET